MNGLSTGSQLLVLLLPFMVSSSTSFPVASFAVSQTHTVVALTATPTPSPTLIPSPRPTRIPPSPTQAPVPTAGPQTMDNWFTTYANKESVNPDLLKKIARCESNLHPGSVSGDYVGLYQFSTDTWKSTRLAMNANPDPGLRTNPEESIKTAAFRLATHGRAAWPQCSK